METCNTARLPTRPLAACADAVLQREAGLIGSHHAERLAAVTRSYLRGYHRLAVRGAEHLPASAPFCRDRNHTSHLDALTLAAALPWRLRRAVFPIAAGDVFFETPVAATLRRDDAECAADVAQTLRLARACEALRERLIGGAGDLPAFSRGNPSREGRWRASSPGIGMIVAGAACRSCRVTFPARPPPGHRGRRCRARTGCGCGSARRFLLKGRQMNAKAGSTSPRGWKMPWPPWAEKVERRPERITATAAADSPSR